MDPREKRVRHDKGALETGQQLQFRDQLISASAVRYDRLSDMIGCERRVIRTISLPRGLSTELYI